MILYLRYGRGCRHGYTSVKSKICIEMLEEFKAVRLRVEGGVVCVSRWKVC